MTSSLDSAASEVGVAVADLTLWIERRWVRPTRCGAEVFFDDVDLARLRLIVEFRRDLAIDEEAMPVVLDLIDRLHATRTQLRRVLQGVAELPLSAQDMVFHRITREPEP